MLSPRPTPANRREDPALADSFLFHDRAASAFRRVCSDAVATAGTSESPGGLGLG